MIAAFLWLCVALLACALPFMLYQLVKGSGLRLEADGFRMTQPWRKRFTRWNDTSDFDIRNVSLIPTYGGGWSTLVIFDDKGARQSKLASLNVSLVGRNSALPDSYGMTPDELRNLMNGWRKLALAR
jgi:hypothetical protein